MSTVFLEKICRCCLNESEDMTNLFDCVASIDSFTFKQHFTYSDLIYLCTNVRCDLDVVDANEQIVELPRNVCDLCVQELKCSFVFRQKCESSDNLLREQTTGINHEEIVEFDHTTDAAKKCQSSAICPFENHDQNNFREEQRDFMKDEQTISIEINKQTTSEENANEVEIRIVSIASDEYIPFESEQQVTYPNTVHCCSLCKLCFESELDLQSHNRQHHQDKKYKCTECPEEFHTQKSFIAHGQMHTDKTKKKKFLCSICGKFFATRQRMEMHMVSHSSEKRYTCNDCDKKFASESRLRCHRRTHTGEKPYRCNHDQCGLTFAQGNALRCHIRTHTGEKPYECRFCNKKFTQNTILKTHMTLHTGKKIKCPDCDKMFSRASNLILHRREHTGEKPYACSRCPNRYKQKSHLDRHIDTHLGIKHTCEICQKVYSKRWSLKVHMFTHSKEKPHKCTICEAEFTRRDKFKIHLKSAHGLTSLDSSNSILTNDINEDISK